MTSVTLLSTVNFTDAQLEKLQAMSPRLKIHQLNEATIDDVPAEVRDEVEILYGWGVPPTATRI